MAASMKIGAKMTAPKGKDGKREKGRTAKRAGKR